MDRKYFENGIAVISLSGEEAFATKYSMEAFTIWYDDTYKLSGCTREELENECERVSLDHDGTFVNAAELKIDVQKYKQTHKNCEFIDCNNRKIGQWFESDGAVFILMSYREIIRKRIELGELFIEPVMLMSVYGEGM